MTRGKQMRGIGRLGLMLAACSAPAAWAQHADDNPVVSAEDGFGLTVGLESTGIYGPGNIRGFNPQSAGNARIDGLYFDQEGGLSNRVIEDSTIRVGISAINYPFPAPTGIVDYQLRKPADDHYAADVIAEYGPFTNRGISVDASLPLSKDLQVPIGVDYQRGAPLPNGDNLGYGSTVANAGVAPVWKPSENVTVRALFDRFDQRQADTLPTIFGQGDIMPPKIGRGYLGQDWALNHYLSENYGALVDAKLSKHWSLAAGMFHSVSDTPVSYADLYLNTTADGEADHVAVSSPDQHIASTSGEARLTGRFERGKLLQSVVLLLRGRNELSHYGGSDAVDLGQANIASGAQAPEPQFVFSPRTGDHTTLWSAGTAYQAGLADIGEVAVGVQKEFYGKNVAAPDQAPASLSNSPWRFYGNVSAPLVAGIAVFAGYTQGFEDSGIAPNTAANRNAILPTTLTWQADAGLRYPITSKLALITGVFELNRPYFNLDQTNVDRQLGQQRATGLELSLAGELVSGLFINGGALIGQVKVVGQGLAAEGVGNAALGQPHNQFQINLDYTLPWYSALSFDMTVYHFGTAPATVDDGVYAESVTLLNLGSRFRFKLWGASATLRAQVQNLTNSYIWNITNIPGFLQFAPRTGLAYLTIDI
jgi:iron complex outermembrane recepter protein